MEPRFNLIDEKWIPVITNEGKQDKLGLQEVILKAHNFREIHDSSPLVTASLHRMLLALLHRVYGPYSDEEWIELYRKGKFAPKPLKEYLEKWRDRFWLLHDKHPFYQTVSPRPKVESVKVDYLRYESQKSGRVDRMSLFDHGTDDYVGKIPLGMAGRLLVAYQNYDLGGLGNKEWDTGVQIQANKSFKDSPLSKLILFLVQGRSLFETLLLNSLVLKNGKPIPGTLSERDKPAWEIDRWKPRKERKPKGYLQLLTWQSRRILLECDETGDFISGFYRSQGDGLKGKNLDPQATVIEVKERGLKKLSPLGFTRERVLWRDSVALLQLARGKERRGPFQISHLARMSYFFKFEEMKRLNISAYGICTNKAKVHFWRHETLPIPLAYLKEQKLVESLQLCLAIAESVSKTLRWVARDLAKELSTSKGAKRIWEHFNPQPYYWSALEPCFYETMDAIAELGERDPKQKAEKDWAVKVYNSALDAFHTGTKSLDRSAKTLKALTEAERYLQGWLLSEEKSPLGSDFVQHIKGVKYGRKK